MQDGQPGTPSTGRSPAVSRSSGPFDDRGAAASAREQYARRLAGRSEGAPALNRLSELAARLLGTGSAQISIIAEAQTVMGGAGDAASSVGGTSPASDSLCTVTVAANEPVLVADAAVDDRVRLLSPVTSGVVGSYLGVPLVAAGHTVGALCVFDRSARSWTAAEVALLEQLAEPALAELELAALEAAYHDDRLLWQLAVDAAEVGIFDWNLTTGELRWDDRLLELFGVTREAFGGTIEAFSSHVHPEDRDRVIQALDDAVATQGSFAVEYRVALPGGFRWVTAKGQALGGQDGTTARVLGAAFDSTAVQDGEARVARVLEAMPSAFFHLDRSWRFTYANTEAERLLGGIGSPILGGVIWELFPSALGSEFEVHYRRAMRTGEPVEFEAYYPPPLDDWYEVRAWPTPDGLSVYFLDVTDRRRAQDAVVQGARRDQLLAEVTRSLTETLDPEEAVARLAQIVVPLLGDWCVVTVAEGNGPADGPGWRHRLRDIGNWHVDPVLRARAARYAEVRIPSLSDSSFVATALAENRTVLVPHSAAEAIASTLAPGEAQDLVLGLDPSAAAIVPLRGRGRTAGLLTVFRGPGRETFSPADLDTLTEVAGRAGLALDTASDYTQQRDLAEGLQRSLLTAPPRVDGMQVAVRYEPAAGAAQVGGDWYDAFRQRGGALNLVIGDVVGHDTAAAAAMGQVRTLLRGIAVATDQGPAEVLREVDETMRTLQVETTATAVVARLERSDEDRGPGATRVRWSNAGHPPPLLAVPVPADEAGADPREAEVSVMWAASPNLLLGLDPSAARTETVLTLPAGATLLLYTDGLVERRRQPLDDSIAELQRVFHELVVSDVPLEDLCDELLRRMLPERPDDDVALVAVRLRR